jgi:hypothetical protein
MLAPPRMFTRQSVGERSPSLPHRLKPRSESISLFPDEASALNLREGEGSKRKSMN